MTMRAACWYGVHDVRVVSVPAPRIVNNQDAVVKVSLCAICGSDLHLYDGYIPTMEKGDILGHESMGEVVEIGSDVKKLKVGDRVVIPFTISCGRCFFCQNELWSLCDNSNPNAGELEALYGFAGAGLYGYSHLYGGYPGGQAEYIRVPFADYGPLKIPDGVPDEKVLFLSDIFPTGYMAAENCGIRGGEVIAVWGCGPVGQFAIRSALLLGADHVIAIDRFRDRLDMAAKSPGVEVIDYSECEDLIEELKSRTGGRGPDACIDAVGLEAHGATPTYYYDKIKQAVRLESDRPIALREAVQACRKGGTVSVPGVYGGFVDKMPMGSAFAKGLSFKMGQTHVQKYMEPLLGLILENKIDPSSIITHRMALDEAAPAYRMFREKQNGCVKVVLKP